MVKRQNIRKGMIILTFLLFPAIFSYASPFLIIWGASLGIISGSFIFFIFLFIFSLFFGRIWCGYVCPAGGLQECLILAQDKKAKGGKLNLIKYIIWIPWLCTIVFFFVNAGGIKTVDAFFHIPNGISISGPFWVIIVYFFVVMIFTVLSLFAGKRASCHYLCWMAPFMILGTKISRGINMPSLHIKTEKSKCNGCNRCSQKCPMSLDVKYMVENEKMTNSECIMCGECIDICSTKAIKYTFGK